MLAFNRLVYVLCNTYLCGNPMRRDSIKEKKAYEYTSRRRYTGSGVSRISDSSRSLNTVAISGRPENELITSCTFNWLRNTRQKFSTRTCANDVCLYRFKARFSREIRAPRRLHERIRYNQPAPFRLVYPYTSYRASRRQIREHSRITRTRYNIIKSLCRTRARR